MTQSWRIGAWQCKAFRINVCGPLSPDTAHRLQTATTEQLELWADRILDAPTLAAVFDEH